MSIDIFADISTKNISINSEECELKLNVCTTSNTTLRIIRMECVKIR